MSERETSRIYQLKIEDLNIKDGFNVRIEDEQEEKDLLELAQSIATKGILEPLTVFLDDEQTYIENGHRRMAATLIANKEYGAELKTLPCRYESKFVNEIDRTENLLVRASGKPFSMLEQAEVIRRLLEFGRTEELIADRCVCSITHIKNLVLLGSISEGTRAMILSGHVAATNAIEAVRKFGAKHEEVLVQALANVQEGKKKVTQKQLGKGKAKGIDWEVYGPRLQEMLYVLMFSAPTEEVRAANESDAKALLEELERLA